MRVLTTLACIAMTLLPLAAQAAVRWQDAETWVAEQLAPAVVRQLTEHPRFRGQTIRVVSFENDAPAGRSSALAIALRDQLSAALLEVPGLRMAAPRRRGTRLDCTLDDVDYYIGLQVSRMGARDVRLSLRTLEVRNNTWVTGFDMSWQGALTSRQRGALRTKGTDPWFQGGRAAPFDDGEADVMARKLAHELACASMRQLGGEYVVLVEPDTDAAMPGVTELIANNLTGLASMQFTKDQEHANAVLRGKAHAVDRELGQFWATLAPIGDSGELAALNASAYVRMHATEPVADARRPEPPLPAPARAAARALEPAIEPALDVPPTSPARPVVALPPTRDAALLRAALVVGGGRGVCGGMGRRCAALEMRSRETAAVFFLNHQPHHGLVRLAGAGCRKQSAPRVLRANATMTVPLPASARNAAPATVTRTIALQPGSEIVYALAVSDSRAALAFSRHLNALPQRCTAAARFGLRDDALAAWLERFEKMIEAWSDDVDLRAVSARGAS